ncbi:MAG: cytochrome c oxidase subunit II [Cyclobacteriaceae bacterium]|nr:cytochrome c oxidase subunit II [Cyclobacteriaceae bacterium]
MFQVAIGIGVVLVLVILLMLFRVQSLLNVAKGSDKKIESTSNRVNGLLFLLFMIAGLIAFFWYSIAEVDNYKLPNASDHGILTDQMFWITTVITGIVFVLGNIALFWFAFRYQYKEANKATFYPDNHKLEIIWTVIPAIVLTLLVGYGLKVWTQITDDPPQGAEVVEIMGYQFAWKVRYPGKDGLLGAYDYQKIDAINEFGMDFSDKANFDDFVPREIHVPKGQPVLLKIRARDVLHSVYLPHFRVKMDAVPGMPTRFWFVPTKSTAEMREETGNPDFNYELACTEICGRGHFSMRMVLVVDEPADYKAWYAIQEPWLTQNPSYMAQVPANLQEVASIATGLETVIDNN